MVAINILRNHAGNPWVELPKQASYLDIFSMKTSCSSKYLLVSP